MTVRAVDMQTQVGRLGEASRLQHLTDMQSQVTQHAQTKVVQTVAERAQSQVNQRPSAQQQAIGRDGRGNGGGGQNSPQGQPRKQASPKPESPAEPGLGQRLDVKL
ncbi:MAG TPA: hypothetical protein VK464_16655 [Symbiobacteriaceae bacterium]|nr:hypothetical protein [Symbiobacteriaceae bacterium]